MSTTRRDVLRGLGIGAAGALTGLPLGLAPRRAEAQSVGNCKVLEVFLLGGLSAFESLFVPEDTVLATTEAADLLNGTGGDPFVGTPWPSGNCWPVLHDPVGQTAYGSTSAWGYVPTATYSASATSTYQFQLARQGRIQALKQSVTSYWINPTPVQTPGGTDSGGYLGPAFAGLTSPLFQNMSVIPLQHGIGAHPPAVHLMLTGTTMGRSYAHGLGAMVRKVYEDPADLSQPTAFTINVGQGFAYANMAGTTGELGPEYRPPVFAVGRGTDYGNFQAYLPRAPFILSDPLVARYRDRYEAGIGGARSEGFDAYRATFDLARFGPQLSGRLTGETLNATSNPKGPVNQAIQVAAHLLAQSETRYVSVLTGGYDTHTPAAGTTSLDKRIISAFTTTFNLWEVLEALQDAALGSDVLVVLNTDFGRRHEGGGGAGHWPQATGVLLLGGPVQPGVTIRGGSFQFDSDIAIRVNGAEFGDPMGPAHLRKAMSLAAGVPFNGEAIPGEDSDPAAAADQYTNAFFGQG